MKLFQEKFVYKTVQGRMIEFLKIKDEKGRIIRYKVIREY